MPARYHDAPDPLLAWNRAIIEATSDHACVYKPNIAFYEVLGRRGYDLLEATLAAIPPEIPVILDAKRGDIGSTAEAYAEAIFDLWRADAVTVSPYLGGDSLEPFLRRADRGVFVLCHTSNPGAGELQGLELVQTARRARARAGCSTTQWPSRPGRGTGTATSGWWWAPPIRSRCAPCARSRPTCGCWRPASAHRGAAWNRPSRPGSMLGQRAADQRLAQPGAGR